MNVLDLFSGCGGLSLGFIQAGFNVNRAVEFDSAIANTYKMNHPSVEMFVDDITHLVQKNIFQNGEADIIIGGPPCQREYAKVLPATHEIIYSNSTSIS